MHRLVSIQPHISAAIAVSVALSAFAGVVAAQTATTPPQKAAPAPVARPAAAAAPAPVAGAKPPAPAVKVDTTPVVPVRQAGNPGPPPPTTPEQQAKLVALMNDAVHLTPSQMQRVNAVYDKQRANVAAINEKYAKLPPSKGKSHNRAVEIMNVRDLDDARLAGILTPQQMATWMAVPDPRMAKYREDAQKRLDKSRTPG